MRPVIRTIYGPDCLERPGVVGCYLTHIVLGAIQRGNYHRSWWDGKYWLNEQGGVTLRNQLRYWTFAPLEGLISSFAPYTPTNEDIGVFAEAIIRGGIGAVYE